MWFDKLTTNRKKNIKLFLFTTYHVFLTKVSYKGKKIVTIFILFLILFIGVMYYDLTTETPNQQELLELIRSLGFQDIQSLEIIRANKKKGIVEKKLLNPSEIKLVQEFLKNADTEPVGGHNYFTYECKLIFHINENTKFIFLGRIYGGYEYNKNDLYLMNLHSKNSGSRKITKYPRPIRVKDLGKWIIENDPGDSAG